MTILVMGTIYGYIILRLSLQLTGFSDRSMQEKRMYRVILGIVAFPLVTIFYLSDVINYIAIWVPGSWALPPIPVAWFLAWIIFVVTDLLYQFHKISKIDSESGVEIV